MADAPVEAPAAPQRHLLVLHVLRSLDFGGVERRMEVVARHAGGGVDHAFCAIEKGGAAAELIGGLGRDVHVLGRSAKIPNLGAIVALWRMIRRVRPDVVHCHGVEANFHGLIAARAAGTPVRIGEEIGMPRHGGKAKAVLRRVFKSADAVVTVSDAVRRWMIEAGEIEPDKCVRIYAPVLLPAEQSRARASGEPLRVGFVGRLHPIKNPEALIRAVGRARQAGASMELVLVGEGEQRSQLESLVAELELGPQVHFTGFSKTPREHLRDCHVYAQPSLTEGFAIAIIEAMGCGLPVIATQVGGSPEIIEEGATGWLVAPTVEAITQALIEACRTDPGRLRAMGLAARDSVVGRFEPELHLRALEALYIRAGARAEKSRAGRDERSVRDEPGISRQVANGRHNGIGPGA